MKTAVFITNTRRFNLQNPDNIDRLQYILKDKGEILFINDDLSSHIVNTLKSIFKTYENDEETDSVFFIRSIIEPKEMGWVSKMILKSSSKKYGKRLPVDCFYVDS